MDKVDYKSMIRKKNNALAITLFISIAIRGIANSFYVGGALAIAFIAGGLVLSGLIYFLNKKLDPVVVMYFNIGLMTFLCFGLMYFFPCVTNFMMIYMSIYFVVIYEDIKPIIIQTVLSAACMIWAYVNYSDKFGDPWGSDPLVMSVVYLVSGMIIFLFLCKFSKEQLSAQIESAKTSDEQKNKAEGLLQEIGNSVDALGSAGEKISESISVTKEISGQIATAAGDVTKKTSDAVEQTESIKEMVQNSVDQVKLVSQASSDMASASGETEKHVSEGGQLVQELQKQMEDLSARMQQIADAINELNSGNKQIAGILGTLDEITEQTNLLSLNASIEAARAGEAGKGFAVVASEIRSLSDNSAQFTDEIHKILDGIAQQTDTAVAQLKQGLASVSACSENTGAVDNTFRVIASNTGEVLNKAHDVANKAAELDVLLASTLGNASSVSESMESTSAAMAEVSSSISRLNGNIASVVDGYNEINGITDTLIEVSEQSK